MVEQAMAQMKVDIDSQLRPLLEFIRTQAPAMRADVELMKNQAPAMKAEVEQVKAIVKETGNRLGDTFNQQKELKDQFEGIRLALATAEDLSKKAQLQTLETARGLHEMEEEVKKLREGGGRRTPYKGVDPKGLVPPSYRPTMDDTSKWRDWAFKSRSYLGVVVDPALPAILKKAETRKEEIEPKHLDGLGMQADWEIQLRSFLNGTTEGDAFNTVRSGETLPALEL